MDLKITLKEDVTEDMIKIIKLHSHIVSVDEVDEKPRELTVRTNATGMNLGSTIIALASLSFVDTITQLKD